MNETCRTSTETSGRLWNVCGRASRVRGKSESFSWIKGWCYSSLVSQIVSSGEKMIRCRITETRRKRWRATNRRQNSGCLHQEDWVLRKKEDTIEWGQRTQGSRSTREIASVASNVSLTFGPPRARHYPWPLGPRQGLLRRPLGLAQENCWPWGPARMENGHCPAILFGSDSRTAEYRSFDDPLLAVYPMSTSVQIILPTPRGSAYLQAPASWP
jgi:hypothetical protein